MKHIPPRGLLWEWDEMEQAPYLECCECLSNTDGFLHACDKCRDMHDFFHTIPKDELPTKEEVLAQHNYVSREMRLKLSASNSLPQMLELLKQHPEWDAVIKN